VKSIIFLPNIFLSDQRPRSGMGTGGFTPHRLPLGPVAENNPRLAGFRIVADPWSAL